jgi:hypothetical protein
MKQKWNNFWFRIWCSKFFRVFVTVTVVSVFFSFVVAVIEGNLHAGIEAFFISMGLLVGIVLFTGIVLGLAFWIAEGD